MSCEVTIFMPKIMVGVYYLVKEKYLHSSQAFTKKGEQDIAITVHG